MDRRHPQEGRGRRRCTLARVGAGHRDVGADRSRVDRDLVAGHHVGDRHREHVGPVLLQQRRGLAARLGLLVFPARLLALLDLGEPALDIRDLKIDTVIGIFDWERRIRQTISIDLEMAFDIRKAAASDRIEDTLDYKAVGKRIIAHAAQRLAQEPGGLEGIAGEAALADLARLRGAAPVAVIAPLSVAVPPARVCTSTARPALVLLIVPA